MNPTGRSGCPNTANITNLGAFINNTENSTRLQTTSFEHVTADESRAKCVGSTISATHDAVRQFIERIASWVASAAITLGTRRIIRPRMINAFSTDPSSTQYRTVGHTSTWYLGSCKQKTRSQWSSLIITLQVQLDSELVQAA
jgi:hypothetical protein